MNEPANTPNEIVRLLPASGHWAILHHTMPTGSSRNDHFDLLIELDSALITWACDGNVLVDQVTAAKQLADHRKAYLVYEGPISNNRGEVRRLAAGNYRQAKLLGEDAFSIRVSGDLVGELRFKFMESATWEIQFQ